jgi:hypothetical protein
MKRVKTIISCLKALLKKNFFKFENNDKSHECNKVFVFEINTGDLNTYEEVDEYFNNYTSITRWQTV